MSSVYQILIIIISAITGGVITFVVQHISDRIRERRELLRAFRKSAGPLMYASYQLFRRIQNILKEGNYEALARSWTPKPYWPMTHSYFVESTEYLFAVFFAYLESYYLSTLHFAYGKQEICRSFNQKARDVQRTLSDVSLNERHLPDNQIYLFEQIAMGYAVLAKETTIPVMDFFNFKQRMATDQQFHEMLLPVENLIVDISPDAEDFRFERIEIFAEKVKDLYSFLADHTHGDIYGLTKKIRETGDIRSRNVVSEERTG